MSGEENLSDKVRVALEDFLERKSGSPLLMPSRGPNPAKSLLIYQQMPLIHEALGTSNQSEVLDLLKNIGLPTSRVTFRRIYLKWAEDTKKVPRMAKVGERKKKRVVKSKTKDFSGVLAKVSN